MTVIVRDKSEDKISKWRNSAYSGWIPAETFESHCLPWDFMRIHVDKRGITRKKCALSDIQTLLQQSHNAVRCKKAQTEDAEHRTGR